MNFNENFVNGSDLSRRGRSFDSAEPESLSLPEIGERPSERETGVIHSRTRPRRRRSGSRNGSRGWKGSLSTGLLRIMNAWWRTGFLPI